MAIINITIPFLLITWAEQSVESSLAAILTSPVPLFAIVLSAIFLADEPMRVNGLVGLIVGFIGVVIITSRGLTGAGSSVTGEIALLGAAFSYACGAVYSRRNVRGPGADDPGGLPGDLRGDHHRHHRARCSSTRGRRRPTPRRSSRSCGSASSARGSPTWLVFRLFAHWGATRTTLVAYLIPVVGIVLGYLVLARADRRPDHLRDRRWSSPASGWSTAGSAGAGCSVACRRSRRPRLTGRAPRRSRLAPTASSNAPPTISTDAPIRRVASRRSPASPIRTEPQAAAKTVADSRSGATPDSGATLSATRMHR